MVQILKTKDVADMLGIDVRTVQKQAQANYFPPEVCGRIGNQYIFNAELLFAFLFSNKQAEV